MYHCCNMQIVFFFFFYYPNFLFSLLWPFKRCFSSASELIWSNGLYQFTVSCLLYPLIGWCDVFFSIEGCWTRLSAEQRPEPLTSEQSGHGRQVCAGLTGRRHRVQKDGPQGQWEEMLWVTGFISPGTVEVWHIIPPRSVSTGYCLMPPCNGPQASVFQLSWAQTALTLIVKYTHTPQRTTTSGR